MLTMTDISQTLNTRAQTVEVTLRSKDHTQRPRKFTFITRLKELCDALPEGTSWDVQLKGTWEGVIVQLIVARASIAFSASLDNYPEEATLAVTAEELTVIAGGVELEPLGESGRLTFTLPGRIDDWYGIGDVVSEHFRVPA